MATYIMLTRLSADAIQHPQEFEAINQKVTEKLNHECPGIRWLANFLVLGPYDYLDIFEAADNEEAARVAVIIRSYGHGITEIWPAVAWERFRDIALKIA